MPSENSKGLVFDLIVQGALQVLCCLPFFYLYLNWSSLQAAFLPAPTAVVPAMLQAIPGQIQLAQSFAIVAALLCTIYFSIYGSDKKSRQHLLSAVLVGLIAQGLVLTRCLQFPLAIDDPFIDFRYVNNWLSFRGFDYNYASQYARVQGFSSPLHLLLLYLASLLFHFAEVAKVSTALNLILQLVNLLLVYKVAARFKFRALGWLAAWLYAFGGSSMLAGIDNKESALVQLLLLISIELSSHHKWCPTISALLSLTRPEGIVWFAREFICDIIEKGKASIMVWLPAILALVVWYGFTLSYYGSAIPHGALGRSTMFHSYTHLTAHSCPFILTTLGVDVFHHLFLFSIGNGETQAQILTVENLLKGAAAFILLLYFARKEEWLASYAYNCVLLLLFFAVFDPWMFSWYYSWFSLTGVFLIPLLLQLAWSIAQRPHKVLTRAAGVGLLGLVTVVQVVDLNMTNWLADKSSRKSLSDYVAAQVHNTFFVVNPAMQRLALYKQAADYLRLKNTTQETKKDATTEAKKVITRASNTQPLTLATWEPGILGYYLPDSQIIDLGGLVTDETLTYYPVPLNERSRRDVWGSIPAKAVTELQPETVIFFDSFADNGLLRNPQFLKTYKLTQFWPLQLWGGKGLFLFEKQKAE